MSPTANTTIDVSFGESEGGEGVGVWEEADHPEAKRGGAVFGT